MKLSLFLCLLMVAMCAAGKDWAAIKKWQKIKVMEWCYGEENIKTMMIKWKKAYAECSGIEMPELGLPGFSSPYRLVKALMDGAEKQQDFNMEQLLDHFQHTKPMPQPNVQLLKVLLQQQQEQQMPAKRLQNMLLRQMISGNLRSKRQAEEGSLLELGEKLSEKLEKQQMEWQAKAGNMTCMLKKLKYIKNDESLYLDGILSDFESYTFPDKWLETENKQIVRRCYAKAEALPREVLEQCVWGDKAAKIYEFMKCCKMEKYKTCMYYDVKQKLEQNFGPLESLVEQTGMPEKQLLPMIQELLQGEMVGWFE